MQDAGGASPHKKQSKERREKESETESNGSPAERSRHSGLRHPSGERVDAVEGVDVMVSWGKVDVRQPLADRKLETVLKENLHV